MISDNTDSLLFNGNSDPIPTTASSTTEPSFLNNIKNIDMTTWIIIILLLSFLGINIFHYLAQGTQEVTDIFKPFVKGIMDLFAYISSLVVGVTAAGTKNIVGKTADAIDTGLTKIETRADSISSKKSPSNTQTQNQTQDQTQNQTQNNTQSQSATTPSSLDSDDAKPKRQYASNNDPIDKIFSAAATGDGQNGYEADDSTSKIQSSGGKSGWCYIGEDRGFRSCTEVSQSDTCMSEQIYPSKELCVNPSLRT